MQKTSLISKPGKCSLRTRKNKSETRACGLAWLLTERGLICIKLTATRPLLFLLNYNTTTMRVAEAEVALCIVHCALCVVDCALCQPQVNGNFSLSMSVGVGAVYLPGLSLWI